MKNGQYEEKDFTTVELADGTERSVPKRWVGTDLLPRGAKAKGRGSRSASSDSGDKSGDKS